MELKKIWREFWRSLTGARPANPTDRVTFNLAVGEEAHYLANRLKKETPQYNAAVLAEVGRILDLEAASAAGLRKVA
jgi:hypothetical protein